MNPPKVRQSALGTCLPSLNQCFASTPIISNKTTTEKWGSPQLYLQKKENHLVFFQAMGEKPLNDSLEAVGFKLCILAFAPQAQRIPEQAQPLLPCSDDTEVTFQAK